MSSHAAVRTAPRHRAVTVRESRRAARHAAPRRPWLRALLASLPTLVAAVLVVLALAAPQQAATAAVRTDTVQPLVRLTTVAPLTVTVPAPTATPAPVIEEDDPAFDCATMGNRACGETRTDARFPGVTFHYVTTHDASGAPLHTYTQRQFDALIGVPLHVSTAADRY